MSQVLDSGFRVNAKGGFLQHLPSLRRLLVTGALACPQSIITVRLPCTLQLSIRVWVGLVMLAKGRCVRVTTDRGRRMVELSSTDPSPCHPAPCGPFCHQLFGPDRRGQCIARGGGNFEAAEACRAKVRAVWALRLRGCLANIKPIQTPRAPATTAFLWLESTWSPSP